MIFLLAALLIFSQNAYCDKLEESLQIYLEALQPKAVSPEVCAEGEKVFTYEDCVKKICPKDANVPTLSDLNVVAIENVNKNGLFDQAKKETGDLLKKWMDLQVELDLKKTQRLLDLIKKKKTKVDPKFSRLHSFNLLFQNVNKIELNAGALDREKVKPTLSNYSPSDQEWILNSLDTVAKSKEYLALAGANFDAMPVATMLSQEYKTTDIQKALKFELERFEKAQSALGKYVSDLKMTNSLVSKSDLFIANLIRNNKTLSEKQIGDFYTSVRTYEMASTLLLSPEYQAILDNRKIENVESVGSLAKIQANLERKVKFLSGPEASAFKEKAAEECFSQYALNLSRLPTAEEKKDGLESRKQVLAGYEKLVSKYLPAAELKRVKSELGKVVTYLPNSIPEFKTEFSSGIESLIDDVNEDNKDYNSAAIRDFYDQGLVTDAYSYMEDDWTQSEYAKDNFDYCKKFELAPVSDKAVMGDRVHWMSWESLKAPKIGRGILAHEIGHIVNGILIDEAADASSKALFASVKDCLSKKHPFGFQKDGIIYSTHFLYVTEDFADLGSGTVLPDVNFACSLLDLGGAESNKIQEYESADDSHSTSLFRAIHLQQLQKGFVPKECMDPLGKEPFPFDFKSCWPAAK